LLNSEGTTSGLLIAHEELSRRLAATSRDAAQVSADLGAEKDARSRADALAESLQGEVADLKKQVLALIRAGKNSAHANPGGDAFTLEDLSSSSAFTANSSKSAAIRQLALMDGQQQMLIFSSLHLRMTLQLVTNCQRQLHLPSSMRVC
jgi:hypothetical protein